MRCPKVKEMLTLYVGGDLPETKVARLKAHLDECLECTAELKALKHARAAIDDIKREDLPENLPEDFADQLHQLVTRGNTQKILTIKHGPLFIKWRPMIAIGGIVVVLLIAVGLWGIIGERNGKSASQWLRELRLISGYQNSEIEWDANPQVADYFDRPTKLDDWTPPGEPGVYAILHRKNPGTDPAIYTVDYCGESRKLISYKGHPWLYQTKRQLLSRAGSLDNIYIAVFLMPSSTGEDRRMLEKALIEAFDPYFNREKGV